MNGSIKIAASHRSNCFFLPVCIPSIKRTVPNSKRNSSALHEGGYTIGDRTELNPSIRNMLKILEPMTLPIAIALFFLKAATSEVTNSGS